MLVMARLVHPVGGFWLVMVITIHVRIGHHLVSYFAPRAWMFEFEGDAVGLGGGWWVVAGKWKLAAFE